MQAVGLTAPRRPAIDGAVVERRDVEPSRSAHEWFELGYSLEQLDPDAAIDAYAHAVEADRKLLDGHLNLGSLLHQRGRLQEAEHAYRRGLAACGSDSVLLFNLGVLLEDLGRQAEAADAYRSALDADAAFADCHYNLALLYEDLGRARDALRHMAQYRKLTQRTPK